MDHCELSIVVVTIYRDSQVLVHQRKGKVWKQHSLTSQS
jgi:hypothetical protein